MLTQLYTLRHVIEYAAGFFKFRSSDKPTPNPAPAFSQVVQQAMESRHPVEPQQAFQPLPLAEPVQAPQALAAVAYSAAIAERPKSAKSPGRPISTSLEKAIQLLQTNPEATPGDLAKCASVSKDYARTLLKRAKAKIAETEVKIVTAAPITMRATGPMKVQERLAEMPAQQPAAEAVQQSIAELRRSLEKTQAEVQQLAVAPVQLPKSMNLNRRASVLSMQQKGHAAHEIASELGINPGEVAFILKVNRMMADRF